MKKLQVWNGVEYSVKVVNCLYILTKSYAIQPCKIQKSFYLKGYLKPIL